MGVVIIRSALSVCFKVLVGNVIRLRSNKFLDYYRVFFGKVSKIAVESNEFKRLCFYNSSRVVKFKDLKRASGRIGINFLSELIVIRFFFSYVFSILSKVSFLSVVSKTYRGILVYVKRYFLSIFLSVSKFYFYCLYVFYKYIELVLKDISICVYPLRSNLKGSRVLTKKGKINLYTYVFSNSLFLEKTVGSFWGKLNDQLVWERLRYWNMFIMNYIEGRSMLLKILMLRNNYLSERVWVIVKTKKQLLSKGKYCEYILVSMLYYYLYLGNHVYVTNISLSKKCAKERQYLKYKYSNKYFCKVVNLDLFFNRPVFSGGDELYNSRLKYVVPSKVELASSATQLLQKAKNIDYFGSEITELYYDYDVTYRVVQDLEREKVRGEIILQDMELCSLKDNVLNIVLLRNLRKKELLYKIVLKDFKLLYRVSILLKLLNKTNLYLNYVVDNR